MNGTTLSGAKREPFGHCQTTPVNSLYPLGSSDSADGYYRSSDSEEYCAYDLVIIDDDKYEAAQRASVPPTAATTVQPAERRESVSNPPVNRTFIQLRI